MITNWEYRVEQTEEPVLQAAMLNKLGAEGWELVEVFRSTGSPVIYYFKRLKAAQGTAQTNFGR